MGKMATAVFWVTLAGSFIATQHLVHGKTQDINRLGAGIVFRYERSCYLIGNYYRLAINIPLPTRVQPVALNLNCPPVVNGLAITAELCGFLRPLLTGIGNQFRELNAQMDQEILKVNEFLRHVVVRRQKRGLLNFVGAGLSYLFGTSTQDDTDSIKVALKRLSLRNTILEGDHHQVENLESFVLAEQKKINRLVTFVNETASSLQQLVKSETTLETEIQYMRAYFLNFNTYYTKFNLLLGELQQFRQAIIDLTQGYLSPHLLSIDKLQTVLDHIHNDLVENSSYSLQYTRAVEVLKFARFIYVRHGMSILIVLRLPLIVASYHNPFAIYRIHKISLPILQGTEHVSTIRLDSNYVAIQKSKGTGIFFTFKEAPKCDNDGTMELPVFQTAARWLNETSCEAGLITDNTSTISNYCAFTVEIGKLKRELLVYNETRYLAINVDRYTTICPTQTGGEIATEHIGCAGICLLDFHCACEARTGDLIMPPRVSENCRTRDKGNKLFAANVILIHKLFNNSQVNELLTSMLHVNEVQVRVPKITVHTPNLTDFKADDEKLTMTLNSVVQKIQTNKTLFLTLQERLMELQPGLFEGKGDDSDWSTFKIGGSGLVTWLALIISGIAICAVILLSIKVKMMTTALVLLTQARAATAEISVKQYVFNLDIIKPDKPLVGTGTVNETFWLTFNTEIVVTNTPYVLLGALSCAILIALLITWRKLNTNGAYLYVQVANHTAAIQICIMKLANPMANVYKFVCPTGNTRDTLRISRSCRPRLEIRTDRFQLLDNVEQQPISIPSLVGLGLRQKRSLRRLLAAENRTVTYFTKRGATSTVLQMQTAQSQLTNASTHSIDRSMQGQTQPLDTTGDADRVNMPTCQQACQIGSHPYPSPDRNHMETKKVRITRSVMNLGP